MSTEELGVFMWIIIFAVSLVVAFNTRYKNFKYFCFGVSACSLYSIIVY